MLRLQVRRSRAMTIVLEVSCLLARLSNRGPINPF